jgi:hypothetical protein
LIRNCLLKHVIERKIKGRIEMAERRARRRKQLLNNLQEIGFRNKPWLTVFRRGYGTVVRQNT